ncbi:uncharacterized protein PHALS_08446 [Plasmopara halstedii]|uniref:Uncharacterized protein n=1 Tax=Plasmopara halstedii TaxID=4781 RepID=A0A0P1ABR7_PLAHL|nr:uncharacterized protein PHALS_08446 [Plasmopara halstedii]CEG38367.1 hypothetical protein PHALS_08446 [Plasmopara halstedii]|eukprot:XP_024574736.1 hypothetical protein PHALS_08446 [Plasmopara halstedii]
MRDPISLWLMIMMRAAYTRVNAQVSKLHRYSPIEKSRVELLDIRKRRVEILSVTCACIIRQLLESYDKIDSRWSHAERTLEAHI